jgi:hypothetical protein
MAAQKASGPIGSAIYCLAIGIALMGLTTGRAQAVPAFAD